MSPGQEIRLVKENLAFAVAFWKAADGGRVPQNTLRRSTADKQAADAQRKAPSDQSAELTKGAANQMRAAFALSALQARRSLAVAFPGEPIKEELPELRIALSVMHLIALAVQRSVFLPVWECPPPYRRFFHIRRIGLTFNATGIGGKALSWDDFGGLDVYLDLLEYCAESADGVPEEGYGEAPLILPFHLSALEFSGVIGMPQDIEPPVEVMPTRPLPGYTENAKPRFPAPRETTAAQGSSAPPAVDSSVSRPVPRMALDERYNLVDRFVAERCETGDGRRILAGDLYAGFAEWCSGDGRDTISQRAFGMRLTALGLRRKRRGHGKHWWEGIRLSESTLSSVGTGLSDTW